MIETKKSFCRFCHALCGTEVDVENNRVLAVRGDRDNVVSQGYTCVKGRAEAERINHPDRLLSSKKRLNGRYGDISSEQALDEIAAKLKGIIDQYGPRSVAIYMGCGAFKNSSSGPWFASKLLDGLNSPSFYTCFTIDSPSFSVGWDRFFGSVVPATLLDVDNAEVVLFAGTNPYDSKQFIIPQSNPVMRLNKACKRGMQVIVIDPRRSYIAKRADLHLQVKPGEDATLLAGMIKIIIDEKLYDEEYVQNFVSGVEDLYEAVKDFDLEYVSQRTQVSKDLIPKAAKMFATAKTGGAQSGQGIHQSRHQNMTTMLVLVLNALCGRIDRLGGMARNEGPLAFQLPEGMDPLPFTLNTGQKNRIRDIEGIFCVLGGFNELSTTCLTDEILTPGEGQIRALLVAGGNPALVLPDEISTVKALKGLDLLVVSDLFMSATAKFADYVFAARHPYERADVSRLMDFAYPFPFGQYTPPLVDAPDGVVEDWEVFWGLAQRLGVDMNIPNVSMDSKPTADDLIDGLTMIKRVPLEEIKEYPNGNVWGGDGLTAGGVIPSMIGHADKKMAAGHPEIINELREVRAEPVISSGGYEPDEDFAFRLILYRIKEVYNTQGQNLPSLQAKRPFNPLLMNPKAMEKLGVKDDEIVIVDSGFGTVEAIVEATEDLKPDVVGLAFGWGDPSDERSVREKGSNVQRLIPDDARFDPVTGLALQTAFPVNVYKPK